MSKVHDDAPIVEAATGKGIVHRPDDVEVQRSPKAAVETACKLLDAAAEAEGERLLTEEAAERLTLG